jgi:SAM-dependent methyltransferase
VADLFFEEPRLARLYDVFDPDRSDLDVYLAIAAELGARSVLDIGCGTGTLACLLSSHGYEVVAVDPAQASLDVARAKPSADRVLWVHGEVGDLGPLSVDLALMTGNVAQVFLTDEVWESTLSGARAALRPGGHLVFETRIPERRAWESWTPEATRQTAEVAGEGTVETWHEVTGVGDGLVTFSTFLVFDGAVLRSESTLRFRDRRSIERSLAAAGLRVEEVRDAPDRPGMEWVFVARRPETIV